MGTAKPKTTSITIKKLGKNLIAVIDGKKFTKVLTSKEEEDKAKEILDKAKLYQKKPTALTSKTIIDYFNPGKAAEEKKAVRTVGLKKAVKKSDKEGGKKGVKIVKQKKNFVQSLADAIESKEVSDDDMDRLRKLLQVTKEVEKVEKPTYVAPVRRSGEH